MPPGAALNQAGLATGLALERSALWMARPLAFKGALPALLPVLPAPNAAAIVRAMSERMQ